MGLVCGSRQRCCCSGGIGAYKPPGAPACRRPPGRCGMDEQLVQQLVWIQGGVPEALRDGPHTTPG